MATKKNPETAKIKIVCAGVTLGEYGKIAIMSDEAGLSISSFIKSRLLYDENYKQGGKILNLTNELEQKNADILSENEKLKSENEKLQQEIQELQKNGLPADSSADSDECWEKYEKLTEENGKLMEQIEQMKKEYVSKKDYYELEEQNREISKRERENADRFSEELNELMKHNEKLENEISNVYKTYIKKEDVEEMRINLGKCEIWLKECRGKKKQLELLNKSAMETIELLKG